MSVLSGTRNALALLIAAGLVLTVVNYGKHDRDEAGKGDGKPKVTTNQSANDGVTVTIKVATHGYPLREKWPVVNWQVSTTGTGSIGGAEPSYANEYTRNVGRYPKGTHVRAWVVPPVGASQAVHVQGISLFFDGVRVDGPLTSTKGLPIAGPAFTAGENQPVVNGVIT